VTEIYTSLANGLNGLRVFGVDANAKNEMYMPCIC